MNKKYHFSLKELVKESIVLLRSIPSAATALFVVSVITMNILANKTILNVKYLAIDGGILVSWLSFMSMDIVTKHYGPRASTRMSIFAMLVNLLTCLIFYIVSIIPTPEDEFTHYFNMIIGGTWFILLSSTIAFMSSAIINNLMNYFIGKMFKRNPDGKLAFVTRCYVSTFIGQFCDNFIFALLTFILFGPMIQNWQPWTVIQCITCSLIGAALELVMEIVFSPIGYLICKNWRKNKVGDDYFAYIRETRRKLYEKGSN